MADNLSITQGSGTTIAADDIAGAKYQRIKIGLGTDGNAADAEGGAGAVSTGVMRVTLASDDPAVALLTTIDTDTGTIATNTGTVATNTGTIATDTGTIATDTTAMSALLTTIDADTGTIATDTTAMSGLLTTIDADTGSMATLLGTIDADTGSIATDMSAALTAVQLIDDAIYADSAVWTDETSKHMLTGGIYQSTRQTVTDGDTAPVQVNNEGVLLVYDLNAGAASGGTASVDDADFTAATTSGTPAMGVYESSPTSVTDGDLGIAGITSTRELKVSDSSAATLLGTIDADTSTLAGAVSGTEMQVDVVGALPTGSNTIGAVTNTYLTNALIGEYETVAASQTDQALGATGGTGDYLAAILIVPATTSPGAVSIKDGAGSAITIFTGGTDSVSNLVPFTIPLGMTSGAGAWQVTTGANVSCIGIGNFT